MIWIVGLIAFLAVVALAQTLLAKASKPVFDVAHRQKVMLYAFRHYWDEARAIAKQSGVRLSVVDWVKESLPSLEKVDPGWYALQKEPVTEREEYAYVEAATLHTINITNFWARARAKWHEEQLLALRQPPRDSSDDDGDHPGGSGNSWNDTLKRAAIGAAVGYAIGHYLGRI